jgi:hypothetical protein
MHINLSFFCELQGRWDLVSSFLRRKEIDLTVRDRFGKTPVDYVPTDVSGTWLVAAMNGTVDPNHSPASQVCHYRHLTLLLFNDYIVVFLYTSFPSILQEVLDRIRFWFGFLVVPAVLFLLSVFEFPVSVPIMLAAAYLIYRWKLYYWINPRFGSHRNTFFYGYYLGSIGMIVATTVLSPVFGCECLSLSLFLSFSLSLFCSLSKMCVSFCFGDIVSELGMMYTIVLIVFSLLCPITYYQLTTIKPHYLPKVSLEETKKVGENNSIFILFTIYYLLFYYLLFTIYQLMSINSTLIIDCGATCQGIQTLRQNLLLLVRSELDHLFFLLCHL